MSIVQSGKPPSLAALYNDFRTRLFNAILEILKNSDRDEPARTLQYVERTLKEWDEAIGYQPRERNVLDDVEAADGTVYAEALRCVRGLHYAIEHVEAEIRLLRVTSDGSPVRPDAAELCLLEAEKLNSSDVYHFVHNNVKPARSQMYAAAHWTDTMTTSLTPPASSPAAPYATARFAATPDPQPTFRSEADAGVLAMDSAATNLLYTGRDSPVTAQTPEPKIEDIELSPALHLYPHLVSPDSSTQPSQFSPRPSYEAYGQSPTTARIHHTPATLSMTLSPTTPMSTVFSHPRLYPESQEDHKFPSESWGNLHWNHSINSASSPPQLKTLEPPVASPNPPRLGLTGPEHYSQQDSLSDRKQWPYHPFSPPPSSPPSNEDP